MLNSMTISDWISVAGIIIGALVGLYIATSVQNNFSRSRSLKDYFIKELSELQNDYRFLINKIWCGELDARNITDTLKNFSARINNLEKFIYLKFKIHGEQPISNAHSKFQQELTGQEDFNKQYKSKKVELSGTLKSVLNPLYSTIADKITERIIAVNESKLRISFWDSLKFWKK